MASRRMAGPHQDLMVIDLMLRYCKSWNDSTNVLWAGHTGTNGQRLCTDTTSLENPLHLVVEQVAWQKGRLSEGLGLERAGAGWAR